MTSKKHRHFVAIPIALCAFVFVGFVTSMMPVRAEVSGERLDVRLSSHSDVQAFNIGTAVTGILQPRTELFSDEFGFHLSLTNGQVLLRTASFLRLSVKDQVEATILQGSLFAVRDQGGVTVVALNTPVVLQVSGNPHLLLAGDQAYIKTGGELVRSRISQTWLDEQEDQMATLSSVRLPAISDQKIADSLGVQMDSSCSEHVKEGHVSSLDLRTLAASVAASGRLTDDAYTCARDALSAHDSEGFLPSLFLLSLALEGDRTDPETSLRISHDIRFDPLLSPLLVRLLPTLAVTSGWPLQSGLLKEYPALLIQEGLQNPAKIVALSKELSSVPRALHKLGLPIQSDAWKSAIGQSLTVLRTTVPTDEHRQALDAALEDLWKVRVVALTSPTSSQNHAGKVTTPTTSWTSEELASITQHILLSHGALLSTLTDIVPDAERQTVLVEGVFLSEKGKNIPYSFTYDPAKELVTKIIRDGRRLPNAVPVKTFFQS